MSDTTFKKSGNACKECGHELYIKDNIPGWTPYECCLNPDCKRCDYA